VQPFGDVRAIDEDDSSRSAVSRCRWRLIFVAGHYSTSSDEHTLQPCLLKSYPPALVHSPVVPLSSSLDPALIPSIPEPPTHSSARMLALLRPRSHPVRVVVGPPRSTHPHPRCATLWFINPVYCQPSCNGLTLESNSLHTEPYLRDIAVYYYIISHCDDYRSVLIDTQSPVLCRCARTTQSWSPAKCIPRVA